MQSTRCTDQPNPKRFGFALPHESLTKDKEEPDRAMPMEIRNMEQTN